MECKYYLKDVIIYDVTTHTTTLPATLPPLSMALNVINLNKFTLKSMVFQVRLDWDMWHRITLDRDLSLWNRYYILLFHHQGRIQNLHCRGGGAQVTNEAEGFTEARSAERGRVGEGVTPSRRWGYGGPPPEIFLEIASKWCILSAFWGNQYTFFALKIYMKKMRLTKFTYRLFIFFLQNFEKSHQNGAFWAHIN